MYLNKPYVKLVWDDDDGILITYWEGFASFEELKAVADRTLEAARHEGARRLLNDTRKMELLDDDSQQYISGEFTLKMVRAGVQFAATVLPEDDFAKESVEYIKGAIPTVVHHSNRYFTSVSKAKKWLKTKATVNA